MSQAHILIVDDEQVIRSGLQKVLERDGQRVTVASCGQQALASLQEHAFDLVITDLKMPGMSGLEVLKTIRRLQPEVPVLIVTGYATAEMATEALVSGAFDFLSKPFTPGQILYQAKRAVDWRRTQNVEQADRTSSVADCSLPGSRFSS
ncbi:MAG: response regulator [Desulfuromonadales bacterium]|nr:response regulator [Desulfuromonadales bacterium]MDW7758844.1 response regulator [Desulfuromonadales bacterium]